MKPMHFMFACTLLLISHFGWAAGEPRAQTNIRSIVCAAVVGAVIGGPAVAGVAALVCYANGVDSARFLDTCSVVLSGAWGAAGDVCRAAASAAYERVIPRQAVGADAGVVLNQGSPQKNEEAPSSRESAAASRLLLPPVRRAGTRSLSPVSRGPDQQTSLFAEAHSKNLRAYHFTTGGRDTNMASVLPPVISPKRVPLS